MKYTLVDFQKEFPNDDVCLAYIFNSKYPNIKGYYRVKNRKCYADAQGNQINPLSGTIFEKSSTTLTKWLLAIYLFSQSKNGVSAKELQRHLGVTYKCAWRMASKIRALMKDGGNDKLNGIVEIDETYIGGKDKRADGFKNKQAVLGMVERGGNIKATTIDGRQTHIILGEVKKNIDRKADVMSDEANVYKKLPRIGYESHRVKHGKKHWVLGNVHTNTIEGFWGQLKTSIRGTYHSVSKKHLQAYIDEFSFRYNHRKSESPVFHLLIARA
jgi:transposase